ncbi:MAG TPA: ABC transporter substrate-binding protein [Candidatus Baltobacteraceae bacterium]|nr:ABC transporter substrate-binding protein [Candidatus Baltobacteraceae bacterium]
MRKRWLGWLIGSLAALVLVAGLVTPAPAGTVLRIAADGDISDVDLHMTTHYLNRVVLLNVYDMLFALGEDMGPRPSLAEKYTVSADGLTYTVTLRKGVKFHSGKTLEAKDVVYSITKMQNKGPRSGQFKRMIKTVEAVDPLTVKFVLTDVNAGFIATLANPIAPAVIYPDGEAERQGGTLTKPIGTGPFEFVEWKKDSLIRLKKFAGYTVDDRPTSGFTGKRLALVDEVNFIPIRDSSVRAAALERGDVDVALSLTQQDVERYKGKTGLTVTATPGISFSDLRFGFKKGIFMNNQKLRQAVAHAIDKEEIVKAVTFGLGKPAPAGIPVGTPYFNPAVHGNDPYGKPNPEKAKQLLKEGGYKGEEIILDSHLQPSIYPEIAVVLQAQMQAVGMNVKVRTLESAALQTTWDGGEFAFFLSGLSPRPDAEIYYCQFWESTSTSTGYKNETYDKLCRAARATLNNEERKKIFVDLENVLRTDVPWIPLMYEPQVQGWRSNVRGWTNWAAGYARAWNVSLSQ